MEIDCSIEGFSSERLDIGRIGDGRNRGMDDLGGNGDEYMIVRILYWDFREI